MQYKTFLIYQENKKTTKCTKLSVDTSLILIYVRSSKYTLNAHSPFLINFHSINILQERNTSQNSKKIPKFPFNVLFPPLSIIPSVPYFCGVAKHVLQNYTKKLCGLAVLLATAFCICQWCRMFKATCRHF